MDASEGQGGVAAVRTAAVRAAVTAAAMRLFMQQGYESTTMQQIADAAGVSRRSLFRYFASKEDIVLGDHAEQGERLLGELRRRPPGENAWQALVAALLALGRVLPYDRQDLLALTRLMQQAPSVRARQLEKRQQWEALLLPEVLTRVPPGPGAPDIARALIACAVGCLDLALQAWVRDPDGQNPEDTFAVIVRGVAQVLSTTSSPDPGVPAP